MNGLGRPNVGLMRRVYGPRADVASHLEWSRLKAKIAARVGACGVPDCRCEWEMADEIIGDMLRFLALPNEPT